MFPKFDKDKIFKNLTAIKAAHNFKFRGKEHLKFQIRNHTSVVLQKLVEMYVDRAIEMQQMMPDKRLMGMYVMRTNRKNIKAYLEKNKREQIIVSESSIYRAIVFLEKAGFLSKEFRGRQVDFNIVFNPQLFFFENFDDIPVDKLVEKYEDRVFLKNQKPFSFKNLEGYISSCTPRILGKRFNLINSSVQNVENSKFSKEEGIHISKISFEGENLLSLKANEADEISQETQTNEERGLVSQTIKSCPDFESQSEKLQNAYNEQIKSMAAKFWTYAKRMLYPGFKPYSSYYQDKLLNQIENLIAMEYLPVCKVVSAEVYFKEIIRRVGIVASYLAKYPDKYIPSPVRYFDASNKQGFLGTKKWYLSEVKAQKENHRKYLEDNLVKQAQKAFEYGKINRKEKSPLEIYAHYNTKIQMTQKTELIAAFNLLAQNYFNINDSITKPKMYDS